MSGSTTQHTETTGRPQPTRNTGQKIAYAFGNLGQAAFYNTMSTFFITFVTTALFIDVDKTLAKRLIAVITGLCGGLLATCKESVRVNRSDPAKREYRTFLKK